MKTLIKMQQNLKFSIFALLVFAASVSYSQSTSELVFKNSYLLSGTALEDGAKYVFPNVTTGIDAVLEIKGRSGSSVVVNNIDITNLGWDKAFQPEIGMPGTAPANTNWWVDFEITFFEAGFTTLNKKVQLKDFTVTGLDIDGDGQGIREYVEMNEVTTMSMSSNTLLQSTVMATLPVNSYSGKVEFDYKFLGPVANRVDIDTNAVDVMATYQYEFKKDIRFRIGAVTGSSTSNAGLRLNSMWFKSFSLVPLSTLPVSYKSFSAVLNNKKADLKWVTASEMNVSHFVVEKSIDGKNYNEAGIVFANGNSNETIGYQLSDDLQSTKATTVYYRIRSVDNDGKEQYSAVRMINLNKQPANAISIVTYPNPVASELRITLPVNWQNKKVVFELFSVNGKLAERMEVNGNNQTETINVSNLTTGMYIIKAVCNGEIAQQKIIKQ